MRLLVFQHIDVEHPGIFRDFMNADGNAWDVIALDRGQKIPESTAAYDALLVMGGPMDVWDENKLPWLGDEKRAIHRWVVQEGKPFLGICLGHQLLAEAIGGSVGCMSTSEVGICDVEMSPAGRRDRLFNGVETRFTCFQWHSAEVRNLPPSAVVCAVNDAGTIQAFRYDACAFGLQFHVEITPDTVLEWGAVPAYRTSLEQVMGPDGLARLDADTRSRLPAFNAMAKRIYDNFVDIAKGAARGLDVTSTPPQAQPTQAGVHVVS
jgi:GMP synthase-like glutamine amidotransferase